MNSEGWTLAQRLHLKAVYDLIVVFAKVFLEI